MTSSKKIFRITIITIISCLTSFLAYLIYEEFLPKIERLIDGTYNDYSILLPITVCMFGIPSIFCHMYIYNSQNSYLKKNRTIDLKLALWICNLGLAISTLCMSIFLLYKQAYAFGLPVLAFAIILLIDHWISYMFIKENNQTSLNQRLNDFGNNTEHID